MSKSFPSRAEIAQLVGDIDDEKLSQILALQPSLAEIEEAVLWADGEADELAKRGHPLTGKAATLYEILTVDIEDEPPSAA